MILLVTGMPYSGKSTFAGFCDKFGIPVISMGNVIRDELKEMGLSEENILSYARALRHMFGREVVARKTLKQVKLYLGDYSLIVVDGVRSMYEVNYFKQKINDNIKILAILAPLELRLKRYRKRKDEALDLNIRDTVELSWGLGDVIALADYYILNDKTKKHLKEETYHLLKKLIPLYR